MIEGSKEEGTNIMFITPLGFLRPPRLPSPGLSCMAYCALNMSSIKWHEELK